MSRSMRWLGIRGVRRPCSLPRRRHPPRPRRGRSPGWHFRRRLRPMLDQLCRPHPRHREGWGGRASSSPRLVRSQQSASWKRNRPRRQPQSQKTRRRSTWHLAGRSRAIRCQVRARCPRRRPTCRKPRPRLPDHVRRGGSWPRGRRQRAATGHVHHSDGQEEVTDSFSWRRGRRSHGGIVSDHNLDVGR